MTVYWSDDDAWYKGTVAALNEDEDDDDDKRVLVEYDDGDVDWMDPATDKWRSFIKKGTSAQQEQEEKVSRQEIGSRISIWWPQEKEYYTGALVEIDNSDEHSHPHRISYDDGDEEWTNLHHRKWKRVEVKALRLKVGSRVSVLDTKDKSKRHYPGTVTKIKPRRPRQHRVRYDNINRGSEWLNLNVHPFLDIEPRAAPPADKVTANTLTKRKKGIHERPRTRGSSTQES